MSGKLSTYIEKNKSMESASGVLAKASSAIVGRRERYYRSREDTGRTAWGHDMCDDMGWQPVYEEVNRSYTYSEIDGQAVEAFPAKLADYILRVDAFATDALRGRVFEDMVPYLETYLSVAGRYFKKDYKYEPSHNYRNETLPPVKMEANFGCDPQVLRGLAKLWNTLDGAYSAASTSPKDKKALVKVGVAFTATVHKGIETDRTQIYGVGGSSHLSAAVDKKLVGDLAAADRAKRTKDTEEAAKKAQEERDLQNALDKLTPVERALLANRPQVLKPSSARPS